MKDSNNPLHKRPAKVTILRQLKAGKLFEFYLMKLDWFKAVFGEDIPQELIHSRFDTWFNATYLKTTKTGRLIWKIK